MIDEYTVEINQNINNYEIDRDIYNINNVNIINIFFNNYNDDFDPNLLIIPVNNESIIQNNNDNNESIIQNNNESIIQNNYDNNFYLNLPIIPINNNYIIENDIYDPNLLIIQVNNINNIYLYY